MEGLLRAVPKIPGPRLITAYLSHSLVTPHGIYRALNLLSEEINCPFVIHGSQQAVLDPTGSFLNKLETLANGNLCTYIHNKFTGFDKTTIPKFVKSCALELCL